MTTANQNLVIPDKLPPIKFNLTKAGLAKLKKGCARFTQVPTTLEAYKELTTQIAEVRVTRVAIETRRKDLKAPFLLFGKKVDGKATELKDALLEMAQPLLDLKAVADEEKAKAKAEKERLNRERLAAIQGRVDKIRGLAVQCLAMDSEGVQEALDGLVALQLYKKDFDEMLGLAEAAKVDALVALRGMVETKKTQEAEDAVRQQELDDLQETREAQAQVEADQAARQKELDDKAKALETAAETKRREKAEKAQATKTKRQATAELKNMAREWPLLEVWLTDLVSSAPPEVKTAEGKAIVGNVRGYISDGLARVNGMKKLVESKKDGS